MKNMENSEGIHKKSWNEKLEALHPSFYQEKLGLKKIRLV